MGDSISLQELQGRGVILNFWSTWCAPCVEELPLLDSVARKHSADGLTVVAVNMGETKEEILDFLESFDLRFPIAIDGQGTVTRLYGVVGLPMSFFIDRTGVIRYRHIGMLQEDHIARGLERIQ
jgi:thiol-disulfide isomerase/thioredoxin